MEKTLNEFLGEVLLEIERVRFDSLGNFVVEFQ